MPYLIREATQADAEEIARVHVASWEVAYAGLLPIDTIEEHAAQRGPAWSGILAGNDHGTLVAVEDGRIAGFASVGASRDDDAAEGEGELLAIYVDPAWWRSGAGSALHAAALDALAERGYTRAVLWVLEANDGARRFYERQGWQADGSASTFTFGSGSRPIVRYRKAIQPS